MNISDHIQSLRKTKGLSQEALADAIGVSRQAVSKWESEQSMPDIDKILLLCEYFDVTSDYLLRGIEPPPAPTERNTDSVIYAIIANAVNIVAFLGACALWRQFQYDLPMLLGYALLAAGCSLYLIGQRIGRPDTRDDAKRCFWRIQCFLLPFLPLSALYNFLSGGSIAPYPIPYWPMWPLGLFWIAYVAAVILIRRAVFRKK